MNRILNCKKEICAGCTFLLIAFIFLFLFVIEPNIIKASQDKGSIDDVYKYAKGIDHPEITISFKFYGGSFDPTVNDTEIEGFAWGNKIGWINLSPSNGGVLNDTEGTLSGYATSEFGGWINFSGVTINSSGEFLGDANSQIFGKISLNCVNENSCAVSDYKVKTDWRPVSVRTGMAPNPIKVPLSSPPSSIIDSSPQNYNSGNNSNNSSQEKPQPLPVGSADQYEGGGDVVKNNTTEEENENKKGGQVTRILTPEEQNIKIGGDQEVDLPKNIPVASVFAQGSIIKGVTSEIKNISIITADIKKRAEIIVETPSVDISSKAVSTAGIAGGSTAIVTTFATGISTFPEFTFVFLRIWSIILSALGLRKNKKKWGVVYDSVTKQPLDPAYVVLEDKKGNQIATSITDLDGRFGFLVPPGKYKLIAKKTNYMFPSSKLFNKYNDELYNNLYFGELIETEEDKIVIKNIPMDPKGFDWNEFAKKDKKLLKFHSPKSRYIAQVLNGLFYFGLILAIALLVFKPDIYNIIMFILYGFLILIKKVDIKSKSYGTIAYKGTDFPVSFAIVKVFSKNGKKEIFHRVADQFGHYYCLLPKGEYYVTIEKKNDDGSYSKIFTSETIFAKKGLIDQDFYV